MKTYPIVATVLLLGPAALAAQDEPPPAEAPAEAYVPPRLADVELARSRACVPALGRLAELDRDLMPLIESAARLQAVDRAVVLEDSTTVAPFDGTDALEAAIRQWFMDDGDLGRQWAASRDTAIARRRDEGRADIRRRIVAAIEDLDARGQGRLTEAGDIQADAVPCDGAVLVRPAVLEVCDTVESPVCEAAADTTASLRFVDSPEDLWDLEEFRPWTDPSALRVLPQGNLGGARTVARARRGNVVVVVAVSPLLRPRAELTEEQVAEFEANLDSLGFTFEHPGLVFAPALEVQLNVAEPLGGETHYMLHFGDLSDPANQVAWSAPVGSGGPLRAVFPAGPGTLALLERGEALSLTALAVDESEEGPPTGEPVYSIVLPAVNQTRAVGSLLAYMAGGQLGQDLARLAPADTSGVAGGGA